jgi:hypothetical protein
VAHDPDSELWKIVSPSRMSISRLSMKKVFGFCVDSVITFFPRRSP